MGPNKPEDPGTSGPFPILTAFGYGLAFLMYGTVIAAVRIAQFFGRRR